MKQNKLHQIPVLNQASGVYVEPFSVRMHVLNGESIYYTLDGAKPTLSSSPKYESPLQIKLQSNDTENLLSNKQTSPLQTALSFTAKEVKCAVIVNAASQSSIEENLPNAFASAIYILDQTLFNSQLPVLSLIVNPDDFFDESEGIYIPGNAYEKGGLGTGNYYKRGRQYEKEGVLHYFNSDGTLGFKQQIGIRINGGYTRRLPQKSLRLYARERYGKKRFHYDFFPDLPYNTFKRLVLRNGGNDYYSTFIRDGLMHELIKEQNIDVQAYRPVIVLLNGEYWGLHNLREKFTKDYLVTKYGIEKKKLALLSVQSKDGLQFKIEVGSEKDLDHYNELISYVTHNDMKKDEHIAYVTEQIDLDNYFEYVAAQVYYANMDSFNNNVKIWRKNEEFQEARRGHDGKWRWMIYDLDWGMGYRIEGEGSPLTFNMMTYVLRDHPSVVLFRRLMENETMRNQFIKKMLRLLNSNFSQRNVQQKITELASKIEPEIRRSIDRWKNIESFEVWKENIQELHQFAKLRPYFVKVHLMEAFNIEEEEFQRIEHEVVRNR